MISFDTFELENGLRIIHHFDPLKSSAALNILYNVGARDENPNKTGFAHLFEHLMFGGSANIPDYDGPLQNAGGQNNAFTTNDLTNYYIQLPVENIETAFWLESDRMKQLDFSQKSLDVQKGVVIEEFKQRYLNQPFGLAYAHLRELAYKKHPYQWPTIGKSIKHVEDASLNDVIEFFNEFYNPNNAIACIAGNISIEESKALFQKWFADIPKGKRNSNQYIAEPEQTEARSMLAPQANAEAAIYIAFHKEKKHHPTHAVADLLSDILGNGQTSVFYKKLIEENPMFTSLEAFTGEDLEPGLFYIVGKVAHNVPVLKAEEALWEVLETFKNSEIPYDDLEARKNKLYTSKKYQDTDLLNKAMALCMSENMGDINYANNELELYSLVSVTSIKDLANKMLSKDNSNTVIYDKIIE